MSKCLEIKSNFVRQTEMSIWKQGKTWCGINSINWWQKRKSNPGLSPNYDLRERTDLTTFRWQLGCCTKKSDKKIDGSLKKKQIMMLQLTSQWLSSLADKTPDSWSIKRQLNRHDVGKLSKIFFPNLDSNQLFMPHEWGFLTIRPLGLLPPNLSFP